MRNPRNERLTGQPRTPAEAGGHAESETGLLLAQEDKGSHVPERTCILSRRTAARGELIRLALGPEGSVHPDVRAKAPGRGAWIGVAKSELAAALKKGKLRGALMRAFKTHEVAVPEDLAERIEAALRQTALDRLGLEARAGHLITGSERIEAAARAGDVHLLIHAADASQDGRRRLDQAWRVGSDAEGSGRTGLVFPAGRAILSLALGRENVVHAALVDRAAAARVAEAIGRWGAFIGPEAGLAAAPADAAAAREDM